jgi:glutamine synthetase
MTETTLRRFLEIPYDELEELNLEAKNRVANRMSEEQLQEHYVRYLHDEKRIKAVTVGFTDLEGRFHMLDYDKKFLLKSLDSLTFDGSSIKGFSQVRESDLGLTLDWGTFRWLPADVFGPGKVLVFGLIQDRDGSSYISDMRGQLRNYTGQLYNNTKTTMNVSVECEGFLFQGINAEQSFSSHTGFQLAASGGYYNTLPRDPLKLFIDALAEAQRALAFENEKDHPEVAPSQFELNYRYCDAIVAADQVQLYKLTARQIAASMGMTASFLPKPVAGINGSGMHVNLSLQKDGVNSFYDESGEEHLSSTAWDFVDRLLNNAKETCLVMNSSVNAYRRLDPNFEAPNQIMSSAIDRTSMVRIPLANKNTARIEVRTVAPDSNPYLTFLTILRTGLEGPIKNGFKKEDRTSGEQTLPGNIYDSIRSFEGSEFTTEIFGEVTKAKFIERKRAVANRCPKLLGSAIKTPEVLFHHDITNQHLWNRF